MQNDGEMLGEKPKAKNSSTVGQWTAEKAQEAAYELALDLIQMQPLVVEKDELPPLMKASGERRFAEIDRWLTRRLAEIKKYWKEELLIPSHRPRTKALEYERASKLRTANQHSWAKLGLATEPEAFKTNPHNTAERIRKGVKRLKITPDKTERLHSLLFLIPLFFVPHELGSSELQFDDVKWARKKLVDVRTFFLDIAERRGLKTEELLEELIFLYLLLADRLEPGTGTTRLLKDAQVRVLGERLSKLTPAETERILSQPISRRQEGEDLYYNYATMSFKFREGKSTQILRADQGGSASSKI